MNQEQDNTTMCQENPKHLDWMNQALMEAEKARDKNEVPVGAVVVYQDKIIARAHNTREHQNHFYGHAEFLALMKAEQVIGDWRLEQCDVYVTLEPCPMCAGAMLQSRVRGLYYSAKDPKAGAIESKLNMYHTRFNHQIVTCGGILEEKSKKLLKDFFKKLRK